MKIFKKLLFILLIVILIIFTIFFIIGYTFYSSALKEKALIERVDEVTHKENFTNFDDLSENYVNAVISIEDHRYYEHSGIDFFAILRALYTNIRNGNFDQGGSTITQQVAKNIIFNQDKNFARKLGEIFAAHDLEKNYSKNEIFELYVNTAYFGDGYYGIYEASKGYYNKDPKNLTLEEASMLAGIPNAPSVYSPSINPNLAKQRQTQVLNAMEKYGYISQQDISYITEK